MLQPIMHVLSKQRIILASSSPRRKEILENIGLKLEVIPSTFDENLDKSSFAHSLDYVKETARRKTIEVVERLKNAEVPPDLVIGADTVVTMDDVIYEKPKDKDDAFRMLSRFSGGSHSVHTAVCLVFPKLKTNTHPYTLKLFHESTDVLFDELSPEVIRGYIDTGEPMDKAGSYGIQSLGGTLVKGIVGDYYNVMGFPLHKFSSELCTMYRK
ncbi:dTTP/UTP pyrophosphatase-like [Lineus longissimus]|uniref:dTTP/UTP pyrophosphatase-like n=1 Tax=Lineus longissimus TaxID=88925 RepID=UPI00315CC28B